MTRTRDSAKAIVIREGCLLTISKTDAGGRYYILPGGGQEFGETLHEALRRECDEELNTQIAIGQLVLVREYIGSRHEFAALDGHDHQVEFMFWCRVPDGYAPQAGCLPDEGRQSVEWLPVNDLEHYRLYPFALRPLIPWCHARMTPVYMGDVN